MPLSETVLVLAKLTRRPGVATAEPVDGTPASATHKKAQRESLRSIHFLHIQTHPPATARRVAPLVSEVSAKEANVSREGRCWEDEYAQPPPGSPGYVPVDPPAPAPFETTNEY